MLLPGTEVCLVAVYWSPWLAKSIRQHHLYIRLSNLASAHFFVCCSVFFQWATPGVHLCFKIEILLRRVLCRSRKGFSSKEVCSKVSLAHVFPIILDQKLKLSNFLQAWGQPAPQYVRLWSRERHFWTLSTRGTSTHRPARHYFSEGEVYPTGDSGIHRKQAKTPSKDIQTLVFLFPFHCEQKRYVGSITPLFWNAWTDFLAFLFCRWTHFTESCAAICGCSSISFQGEPFRDSLTNMWIRQYLVVWNLVLLRQQARLCKQSSFFCFNIEFHFSVFWVQSRSPMPSFERLLLWQCSTQG